MTPIEQLKKFQDAVAHYQNLFTNQQGAGPDPIAKLYEQRRASWSLFATSLSDEMCEALRAYLFPQKIPQTSQEKPIHALHLINGVWTQGSAPLVPMKSLADDRITLAHVAAAQKSEIDQAITSAYAYWSSLEWANEGLAYRKHVLKNVSRLLHYFYEECLFEIRQQTPKTRLEANKDFWEAKRAIDHLEGNAEKAMRGEIVPTMMAGQMYWKDTFLPAGVCALITPMNFIYGIPAIQIFGCYLSGSPFIFKGHPFSALASTTLIKMLIAAGADPRTVHKLEGFGRDLEPLTRDERVAVVSLTGSAETAKTIAHGRGVRPTRFEGGGCNWAYIDDGYSNEELQKIAVRLVYSKLGLSSHKCTTLHGIAASASTLDRIEPMIQCEMAGWKIRDPRQAEDNETKIVGPIMVHKASTVQSIRDAAALSGIKILVDGGKITDSEYAQHAEVVKPLVLSRITPETRIQVTWDDHGEREISLATTEFFMPILVTWACESFERFLKFSLLENPHDLACSIWCRDDHKLTRARRILGGMLKENDGTDSALEWEEFGASGIGESGNIGVGDAETTIGIFSRRQKGRHFVF